MKRFASKIYSYVINPPSDEALARALEESESMVPTIWLIGKTGAGKSTIVQKLTGESSAQVGNGFMPCTRDSVYFDFPKEHRILRFLDTRGLGEAGYDAADDIVALGSTSHVILVVLKIRDGEQSAIIESLQQIRKSARHIRSSEVIVVHTGADEIADDHDRARAIDLKQKAVEAVWKTSLTRCVVDFGQGSPGQPMNDVGADELHALIGQKLPELHLWLHQARGKHTEQGNFDRLSTEVLWYASAAAASDAIPVVGLVTVPGIQGKMLHSLAQKYGIEWDARTFSEFTAALGTGFALRYAVSLGGRQLMKLIPVYGQIAGAAGAMVISYASTYAIGRAACSYLYYKTHDKPLDVESISSTYVSAIASAKEAGQSMFAKNKT